MKENRLLKRIGRFDELGIFLVLVGLSVIITAVNPKFVSADNLLNMMRSTSYVLIVAVFSTMVFIIGGLDLSVGSVIGLGGLITGVCLNFFNLPVIVAVLAGLIVGVIVGIGNGFLVVKTKLPPFIATLGTMYVARGIMNVITEGQPVYPLPGNFIVLGSGEVLGIQYSIIIAVVLAVIVHIILTKTVFGRNLYATGGNLETSRLSGINVDKLRMIVYALSGFAAAFSGIIQTARMNSAQVSTGKGWEMTVIASVIIGGTSMFGGSGSVIGTVIGTVLLTVLTSGMILMKVSAYWQNVVVGAIIIVAVIIDQIKRRKSGDIV